MSTRDKVPDLPDVGSEPAAWVRFMRAVREVIQTREGRRGNALEEGVRFRDLVDLGVVNRSATGFAYTGGSVGPAGPAGPAGPPGTPYVPDLTAPPMPSGLAGVSMFRGAFIEWDAPAYTAGHGNAYTKVYAAQYGGSGPLPTFGTATYAGQAGATTSMYVHDAAMGAQLHFWVAFVTVDGVEGAPAGGTNGLQVTIGKVGNSDLGPLIVEAGNLADDAVVTAKIADAAVGMNQIANNSVSVGKLLVTGLGNVLNADPGCVDASAWTLNQVTVAANSSSPFGGSTLKCEHGTAAVAYALSRPVPIDEAKNYLARIWAQQSAGAGTCYLMVAFQDTSGANIAGGATGWPATGTYFYFGRLNQQPPGIWTEYSIAFGPNETAKIPAGAAFVRIGVLANYSISVPTSVQSFAGLRVSEKATADLIVDGAILARHLSAGSIAVGTAAIQNGAIVNSMIANLAVNTAKIADLAVSAAKIGDLQVTTSKIALLAVGTAQIASAAITDAKIANLAVTDAKIASLGVGKLTAGSLQVGAYVRSTTYVPGATGWTINADGTVEFSSAAIRGTLNGGSFAGYLWPAPGGTGYHLSASGLLLGNYNDGKFFQVTAGGDIYAPNWSIVNGQMSGTFAAIALPAFTVAAPTAINVNLSGGATGSRFLASRTAAPVGGVTPLQYSWQVIYETYAPSTFGRRIRILNPTTATASFYADNVTGSGNEYEATVRLIVTDANGRAAVTEFSVGAFWP